MNAVTLKRNPERPDHATRAAWRVVIARERKALRTGNWGPWERQAVTPTKGDGWLLDVRAVATNDLYVVLIRPFEVEGLGSMRHLAIRTASSLEPPWRDLQRIKDELFGPERLAIQVCPPASQLVDAADMYHLWVYPPGLVAPFGLHLD